MTEKKKKKKPEKEKKPEAGGRPFIQRGESSFILPEKEMRELERRGKLRPEETIAGHRSRIETAELEDQKRIEREKIREEALPVAEETGVFEDRPERVELDVTKEEKKAMPPSAQRVMTGGLGLMVFGASPKKVGDIVLGKDKTHKIKDLIQDPETLRATMFQEIQREELDKSLTESQKLGSLLEPYLGDLKVVDIDIGRYVDKWVRMPKKEVDLIVEQIAEMESSVSGMTDSASQGEIGNPLKVMRDIAKKEETLAIYEARIKRLLLASDELKANPEQVNLIEERILSAKETFFEAKQRAAEGALITPSDSQLFLKLKELRNAG